MASKPSQVLAWATGGSIVEPSAGKKVTGFVSNEQPPAEHFNWILNLLDQWTDYINDPDSISLGSGLLATLANAILPRITASAAANATSPYTLLASVGNTRILLGASDSAGAGIIFAVNATWDGTAWDKVTNGEAAVALFIRRDKIFLANMSAAVNTWADAFESGVGSATGWGRLVDLSSISATVNRLDFSNGSFRFLGTASAGLNDSNPPSTAVVQANSLHAKNIPKSWGKVTINAAGAATVNDGYNVASVTTDTGTDEVTVTFATAMQGSHYDLDITPIAAAVSSLTTSTTGFVVKFFKLTAGASPANLDLGTDAVTFSFSVHARQDS
jgi:hypothetical protein